MSSSPGDGDIDMGPGPDAARGASVAIGGSAGTGKTTLARRLAGRLGLPYLEEGMRRRLEGGLDLHRLHRADHQALAQELLEEMIEAARRARAEAGGFVSDRSPLDLAAFWLYYGFGFDRPATEAYMARAAQGMEWFELVVVLPWGVIPLEEDGIRTPNPWIQLHYHTVLEGLCRRHPDPHRIHWMPPELVDPDRRLDWVVDRLGAVKPRSGSRGFPPWSPARGPSQER